MNTAPKGDGSVASNSISGSTSTPTPTLTPTPFAVLDFTFPTPTRYCLNEGCLNIIPPDSQYNTCSPECHLQRSTYLATVAKQSLPTAPTRGRPSLAKPLPGPPPGPPPFQQHSPAKITASQLESLLRIANNEERVAAIQRIQNDFYASRLQASTSATGEAKCARCGALLLLAYAQTPMGKSGMCFECAQEGHAANAGGANASDDNSREASAAASAARATQVSLPTTSSSATPPLQLPTTTVDNSQGTSAAAPILAPILASTSARENVANGLVHGGRSPSAFVTESPAQPTPPAAPPFPTLTISSSSAASSTAPTPAPYSSQSSSAAIPSSNISLFHDRAKALKDPIARSLALAALNVNQIPLLKAIVEDAKRRKEELKAAEVIDLTDAPDGTTDRTRLDPVSTPSTSTVVNENAALATIFQFRANALKDPSTRSLALAALGKSARDHRLQPLAEANVTGGLNEIVHIEENDVGKGKQKAVDVIDLTNDDDGRTGQAYAHTQPGSSSANKNVIRVLPAQAAAMGWSVFAPPGPPPPSAVPYHAPQQSQQQPPPPDLSYSERHPPQPPPMIQIQPSTITDEQLNGQPVTNARLTGEPVALSTPTSTLPTVVSSTASTSMSVVRVPVTSRTFVPTTPPRRALTTPPPQTSPTLPPVAALPPIISPGPHSYQHPFHHGSSSSSSHPRSPLSSRAPSEPSRASSFPITIDEGENKYDSDSDSISIDVDVDELEPSPPSSPVFGPAFTAISAAERVKTKARSAAKVKTNPAAGTGMNPATPTKKRQRKPKRKIGPFELGSPVSLPLPSASSSTLNTGVGLSPASLLIIRPSHLQSPPQSLAMPMGEEAAVETRLIETPTKRSGSRRVLGFQRFAGAGSVPPSPSPTPMRTRPRPSLSPFSQPQYFLPSQSSSNLYASLRAASQQPRPPDFYRPTDAQRRDLPPNAQEEEDDEAALVSEMLLLPPSPSKPPLLDDPRDEPVGISAEVTEPSSGPAAALDEDPKQRQMEIAASADDVRMEVDGHVDSATVTTNNVDMITTATVSPLRKDDLDLEDGEVVDSAAAATNIITMPSILPPREEDLEDGELRETSSTPSSERMVIDEHGEIEVVAPVAVAPQRRETEEPSLDDVQTKASEGAFATTTPSNVVMTPLATIPLPGKQGEEMEEATMVSLAGRMTIEDGESEIAMPAADPLPRRLEPESGASTNEAQVEAVGDVRPANATTMKSTTPTTIRTSRKADPEEGEPEDSRDGEIDIAAATLQTTTNASVAASASSSSTSHMPFLQYPSIHTAPAGIQAPLSPALTAVPAATLHPQAYGSTPLSIPTMIPGRLLPGRKLTLSPFTTAPLRREALVHPNPSVPYTYNPTVGPSQGGKKRHGTTKHKTSARMHGEVVMKVGVPAVVPPGPSTTHSMMHQGRIGLTPAVALPPVPNPDVYMTARIETIEDNVKAMDVDAPNALLDVGSRGVKRDVAHLANNTEGTPNKKKKKNRGKGSQARRAAAQVLAATKAVTPEAQGQDVIVISDDDEEAAIVGPMKRDVRSVDGANLEPVTKKQRAGDEDSEDGTSRLMSLPPTEPSLASSSTIDTVPPVTVAATAPAPPTLREVGPEYTQYQFLRDLLLALANSLTASASWPSHLAQPPGVDPEKKKKLLQFAGTISLMNPRRFSHATSVDSLARGLSITVRLPVSRSQTQTRIEHDSDEGVDVEVAFERMMCRCSQRDLPSLETSAESNAREVGGCAGWVEVSSQSDFSHPVPEIVGEKACVRVWHPSEDA